LVLAVRKIHHRTILTLAGEERISFELLYNCSGWGNCCSSRRVKDSIRTVVVLSAEEIALEP
jgi:hypothetical protein